MVVATINFAAKTRRPDSKTRPVNKEQEGDLLDEKEELGEEENR